MLKRLSALLLASTVAVTTLLVPAQPSSAAPAGTSLEVSIICDAATNTVRVSASAGTGVWAASWPLTITFQRTGGSYATATGNGQLPWSQDKVTVPVTTSETGTWSATGYTHAWAADDYLFYSENVRVAVVEPTTGREATWRDESCMRDLRTTVSFACDPETNSINVHASGIQFTDASRITVKYYITQTWTRGSANDPGFTGGPLGNWPSYPDRSVPITISADGSWSDPGYITTGRDLYYGAYQFRVEVWVYGAYSIGRGDGLCVYADKRPHPTA
jgi:hypothetical protein